MVPPKANVVIIGAGINGLSTAYHLALKGVKDIVVVEKEKFIAAGSTGLSVGGIRQQFSTEVNVKMAMYSVKSLKSSKKKWMKTSASTKLATSSCSQTPKMWSFSDRAITFSVASA